MLNQLLKSNIAIIGGGKFCKRLLQLLFSEPFKDHRPTILGVSDINGNAEGLVYAGQLGIFTTADYRELYRLKDLQILMELTTDEELGGIINREKPNGVELIDHIAARTVWSALQVEAEKRSALKELRQNNFKAAQIDRLFERFAGRLAEVIDERGERYLEVEKGLIDSKKAQIGRVAGLLELNGEVAGAVDGGGAGRMGAAMEGRTGVGDTGDALVVGPADERPCAQVERACGGGGPRL